MEKNTNLESKVEETKVEENKVDESGATNTNENNATDTKAQNNSADTQEEKLSVDEQLAQLRLENAKLKRATDKATKEASSYKKQLREKQSVEEIEAQEKAEREAQREEEFNALKKENAVNKFEKSFLAQGYPEDLALKSAVALYENDTDTLFNTQKEREEQLRKEIKAEFIANNPQINSGEGEEKEQDAFLEGFKSV